MRNNFPLMPPLPDQPENPPGGDRDLVAELRPAQEKLAQLTKQLQQMSEGPGFVDRIRALRHGGMEKALEKMRDQIATVQQAMFEKVATPAVEAPAAHDPVQALQGQVERLQRQLGLDDQLKQNGLPGILTQSQRGGVQDVIRASQRQMEGLLQRQEGAGRLTASVREALGPAADVKPAHSTGIRHR